MSSKIRFSKNKQSDFYSTLNKRVDDYFVKNKISKNANWVMAFKSLFYICTFTVAYLALILNNNSLPVQFALWIVLGFFTAFIGLNISHDAIHGSLSPYKWVNKTMGYTFNIIGANAYIWGIMHNIVHHTYTNIEGHDEDIESIPLLRMSPHQKLWKVHRQQYWYAFFFYGLASLSWVFIKDYKKFFKKKIGNYDNKQHPTQEYFILFFSKAVYYTLYLVLPLIFINAVWWQVLLGFLLLHFCEGITMAIIFMLAHVVEETHFPLPTIEGNINNSWAVHQLYTTADFGRSNSVLNFFCGGLNFQIEHHLYPRICHVHYKTISNIVKKTALEYNLPYNDNPTFTGAIQSHIRLLKKLGEGQLPAVTN
ncbi:MAG TPA: acyl-CoA desaturase [Panacibacter sp.]|nr:acyl-CoA desaturase [Panacibacter sp.]